MTIAPETDTPNHATPESAYDMNDDTMISFGGAVKSLGSGRIGGYLVQFTGPNDPDLVGEYFTPETDFWLDGETTKRVIYHHGFDKKLGIRQLGRAALKIDDVGVWVEAQLDLRDEYERKVEAMAKAGKLGWSSGSATHLYKTERVGAAKRITSWPIVEATLTPTPAEFRAKVVALKSLKSNPHPCHDEAGHFTACGTGGGGAGHKPAEHARYDKGRTFTVEHNSSGSGYVVAHRASDKARTLLHSEPFSDANAATHHATLLQIGQINHHTRQMVERQNGGGGHSFTVEHNPSGSGYIVAHRKRDEARTLVHSEPFSHLGAATHHATLLEVQSTHDAITDLVKKQDGHKEKTARKGDADAARIVKALSEGETDQPDAEAVAPPKRKPLKAGMHVKFKGGCGAVKEMFDDGEHEGADGGA
jgi:phage head maturation protease